MVKAVIFDLDDTLISEKEYIKSGYFHISKVLSLKIGIIKENIFADLMELFQVSSNNVFNRLYEKYDIEYSKEMILNLVHEYRGHFPDVQFYNDVLPCLQELKSAGIKTGIITDGYAIAQRQKLIAVEADKYFDEIIVTDELGREYWKPHPRAFELMKDRLDVEFSEMIYVGDNPEKDFYINNIYPVKTIRIYREGVYKDRAYLDNIKETYSVHSLIEMIKVIELEI